MKKYERAILTQLDIREKENKDRELNVVGVVIEIVVEKFILILPLLLSILILIYLDNLLRFI